MKRYALWKNQRTALAEWGSPLLQTPLAIVACLLVALIASLTLGPVSWRPHFVGANVDRFVGFLVLGSFLAIAQPKRFFVVCAVIILGAVFLEYSQSFLRNRHAAVHDFEFKVIGGLFGAGVVRTFAGTIRIF